VTVASTRRPTTRHFDSLSFISTRQIRKGFITDWQQFKYPPSIGSLAIPLDSFHSPVCGRDFHVNLHKPPPWTIIYHSPEAPSCRQLKKRDLHAVGILEAGRFGPPR